MVEYKQEDCPNALEILRKIININCSELFTDADIADIIEATANVCEHFRNK